MYWIFRTFISNQMHCQNMTIGVQHRIFTTQHMAMKHCWDSTRAYWEQFSEFQLIRTLDDRMDKLWSQHVPNLSQIVIGKARFLPIYNINYARQVSLGHNFDDTAGIHRHIYDKLAETAVQFVNGN